MDYAKVTLTKNETKILKYLIRPIWKWNKPGITRYVLKNKFSMSDSDIDDLVDRLLEYNLIKEYDEESILYKNEIQITTFGRECLNLKKEIYKSKILWSIIVPIGISFITSLITTHFTK